MSPDLIFRDPYLLDFLGLKDAYSERALEAAILRDLEHFLLELGSDFSFIARQKRITADNEDYYLELLFFHRRLRRLLAVDLKLSRFRAADKGQMELHLRWLEKHEPRPGEESPLGLILCACRSDEHVELLQLERSSIRVSEYSTEVAAPGSLGTKAPWGPSRRLQALQWRPGCQPWIDIALTRESRRRFRLSFWPSPPDTSRWPQTRFAAFASCRVTPVAPTVRHS